MRWENLGHSDVLTTFFSYGEVPGRRQAEIMRSLAAYPSAPDAAAS
jgi:hypothetical protein